VTGVGEEKILVDGDIGCVLIEGGVGAALGKRRSLLMAILVVSSSKEESVELSLEFHSLPLCALSPFLLL
jgi:hypothetical protein